MIPICSLFAIMPLVTGGPEVKLFQSSWNLMVAYLPSLGRCFSNSLSSRMMVAGRHRVGGGILGADADGDGRLRGGGAGVRGGRRQRSPDLCNDGFPWLTFLAA